MGRLTRPVMEAGRGLTGQRGEGQQAGGRGQAGLGARQEPQPRPWEATSPYFQGVSKRLLISWLQSPSAVILEPPPTPQKKV